jgi:6-phosphogluconolactonase (cycloisomerase 2 family)
MKKFLKYSFLTISGLILTILVVALIFIFSLRSQQTVTLPNVEPARFDAKALLAVSDVDMPASAYLDNKLKPTLDVKDTLSIITDENGTPKLTAETGPSNSVMAWTSVVETSSDGKFAYVAELYQPAPDKSEAVEQIYNYFPKGKRIQVYDLNDLKNPRLVGNTEVPERPTALQVSPDGKFLAVAIQDEKVDLQIFRLENGILVMPVTLNFEVKFDFVQYDGAPVHVRWHPNGKLLALNYNSAGFVFVEPKFDETGNITGGAIKGNQVTLHDSRWLIRPLFAAGRFTPDGRFFIAPELGWGNILDATGNGWIAPTNGRIVAIKVDAENGNHEVVSQTEVGASPEGIELSPDGKFLAVVNMETTATPHYFPYNLAARMYSSLSLVSVDLETGKLETVGRPLRFDGVLPENAMFDRNGDMLAVVVFHEFSENPREGWIEYFKFDKNGAQPKFQPTGVRVKIKRGGHDLAVIY